MIRVKDLRGSGRGSVALATALLLLLLSLALSANSSPSAIPERSLGRVRGAMPKFTAVVNPTLPTCSYLQAYDDSSAGTPTVAWNAPCTPANVLAGTACVQCPPVGNYQLTQVAPPPPGVFTTPSPASCNNGPNPAGSSGNCGANPITGNPDCLLSSKYDCDQYAFQYDAEPPGP